jgi:hypothetical protein
MFSERGFDDPQALVECKPRRPSVARQHLLLLDGRVETESERGVPGHGRLSIPPPTDTTTVQP